MDALNIRGRCQSDESIVSDIDAGISYLISFLISQGKSKLNDWTALLNVESSAFNSPYQRKRMQPSKR
jgi:hypothetical protein